MKNETRTGKFKGYCPRCSLMLADPIDALDTSSVKDVYECPRCGSREHLDHLAAEPYEMKSLVPASLAAP